MIDVPFTQVASMLSVDAKTLRQWLKHSHLQLHPHPTDARIKCLTIEQVQQLATLHGRLSNRMRSLRESLYPSLYLSTQLSHNRRAW